MTARTVLTEGATGVLWLVRRQQRAFLWTFAALVVALAGYIVWQRVEMVGYLRDHGIDGCADWRTYCRGKRISDPVRGSGPLADAYFHVYDVYRPRLLDTGRLLLALPVVAGVFVGAPLIARELESGTYRLVWTQSVSRTRWLAARLALPTAALVVGTAILAALYTWWWRTARAITLTDVAWGTSVPFDASGPALVSLTVLCFLLGVALGLVIRRTLPAMAATLAATAGVRYGLGVLRPRLMPTRTLVSAADGDFGAIPRHVFSTSWRGMSNGYLTRSGGKIPWDRCSSADSADATERCFTRLGSTGRAYEDIHPASHFWPLQWIEAGICLAAALALAAFCARWIRRRPTGRAAA
ncbi:translation initiation factor IF-2 [Streptomyces himastatinicus ATCC 53653]|uniref:Translation initiation factor IF-2 n=1 Tax=Streptomyces himastatinicus ATCC 53653 TaxID=457427 RepID=D9WAJ3_9ACTN|nr:translation initiation factor IF-2 [Streptomyces himastatinicus]EFL26934.1 translation initiation factor IF-2 [Streptomyces himastatinicus ATCC 53653]